MAAPAPGAVASRRSRSNPYAITWIFSGGATPSRTRSSRTSSLTATSAPLDRASARSTSRYSRSRVGSKYSASTWPWNWCTTARGRPRPASSAATRPVAPAFEVCVWSTSTGRARSSERSVDDRPCVGDGRELTLQRREVPVGDGELRSEVLESTPRRAGPAPRRRARRGRGAAARRPARAPTGRHRRRSAARSRGRSSFGGRVHHERNATFRLRARRSRRAACRRRSPHPRSRRAPRRTRQPGAGRAASYAAAPRDTRGRARSGVRGTRRSPTTPSS